MPLLKKLTYKVFVVLIVLLSNSAIAQELNCTVQINAQQVTGINADVFEKMENAIYEFLNNQRWTKDKFKDEEKINCNFFFNLNKDVSNGSIFSATLSVQASRPIYGTTYETTIFNFIDKNVQFEYREDQPIFFVDNAFTDNLTSVLGFYAYTILGFDYDSFSKNGGSKYFDKANEVVSYAQQSPFVKGWNIETKNSRYELIQDLTNSQFSAFRDGLYKYHRLSMDVFTENEGNARKNILSVIESLKKIFQIKQNSMLIRIFFMSKSQELINIFSKASSVEKQSFLKLAGEMDAGNMSKYQKINK